MNSSSYHPKLLAALAKQRGRPEAALSPQKMLLTVSLPRLITQPLQVGRITNEISRLKIREQVLLIHSVQALTPPCHHVRLCPSEANSNSKNKKLSKYCSHRKALRRANNSLLRTTMAKIQMKSLCTCQSMIIQTGLPMKMMTWRCQPSFSSMTSRKDDSAVTNSPHHAKTQLCLSTHLKSCRPKASLHQCRAHSEGRPPSRSLCP